jgi:hypothetical protein
MIFVSVICSEVSNSLPANRAPLHPDLISGGCRKKLQRGGLIWL